MKYLNDWTYTVCITLIFSIIFSLLLPKNSNGKVGKIIITVFIMLSLIAPFKANGFDLNFEGIKVINEQQTENKENRTAQLLNQILKKHLMTVIIKILRQKLTLKSKMMSFISNLLKYIY